MLWIINHLLFVSVLIILYAIALVAMIVWIFHLIYRHQATKPQLVTALISIAITGLFSVFLNDLYAMKRDRDSRIRTLRDQHFSQLRTALRAETVKLQQLAATVNAQGRFASVPQYESKPVPAEDFLWPDVMSHDLAEHFPAYQQAKLHLLSEIDTQDAEFRTALSYAEEQLKPAAHMDTYWRNAVVMSSAESCVGRGNGIRIEVKDQGYTFAQWGSNGSAAGKPSREQWAAYHAFEKLSQGGPPKFCQSMRERAETIVNDARTLSKEAQLESESTILKGTCEFLKSDSLSD